MFGPISLQYPMQKLASKKIGFIKYKDYVRLHVVRKMELV